MKTTFNLTEALHERRDFVIDSYNKLTEERFFDGVTLRNFMLEVMRICIMNNIRTTKTLDKKLPILMGSVYYEHSKISATDKVTDALRKKYAGTAFMAMV